MDQNIGKQPVAVKISFFDEDGRKWVLAIDLLTSLDTLDQDLTRIKDTLKAITTQPLTIEVMASL